MKSRFSPKQKQQEKNILEQIIFCTLTYVLSPSLSFSSSPFFLTTLFVLFVRSGVDVKKPFWRKYRFPKIKKLNKVCSDDWTCTKRLKQCYLKLNYMRTKLICSKMFFSCCFSLGENLDFIQKKFYNIDDSCLTQSTHYFFVGIGKSKE